jgi:para-aminobenzoate synthetase component 1
VRKIDEILPGDKSTLSARLLKLSKEFQYVSFLNSNNYEDSYGKYDLLLALGAARIVSAGEKAFETLREAHNEQASWLFGHLTYDLKNQLENLSSSKPIQLGFLELNFFEPAYLLLQRRGKKRVEVWVHEDADESWLMQWIDEHWESEITEEETYIPKLKPRQSREDYLQAIRELKREIQLGNIYETNYCTEFYSEGLSLNPEASYLVLEKHSPMPFSCFYKLQHLYAMGASPERFLCKRGKKLISQPIKGTCKRGATEDEDEQLKKSLTQDLKEQTENVMIVDLVRNDLSRTAARGSVKVKELFGVYTFPQVHQLISTIESELKEDVHFMDVIRNAFPMGSMTGAPKISAMKLAERWEKSRRELYSGAIGYIEPEGDFDFNVVIRSLMYNREKKYLSLQVGGAITNLSEPEMEYEECLLKAKAIFDLNKQEE